MIKVNSRGDYFLLVHTFPQLSVFLVKALVLSADKAVEDSEHVAFAYATDLQLGDSLNNIALVSMHPPTVLSQAYFR